MDKHTYEDKTLEFSTPRGFENCNLFVAILLHYKVTENLDL